jgi:hypothetical protein
MPKFNTKHADAMLFPSARVIADAKAPVQSAFVKAYGKLCLSTTGLSVEETAREERLFALYQCSGAETVKAAAITMATVLASIFKDPDAPFVVAQAAHTGLGESLIKRWYFAQGMTQPELEGPALRMHFINYARSYVFDSEIQDQIRLITTKAKKAQLLALKSRAHIDCTTPSGQTLQSSKIFEGVFDKVFPSPDTLMLEVSEFIVHNYHVQISTPPPASSTLALLLIKGGLSYADTPFSDTNSDANRLEIVFVIASRWMLRSASHFTSTGVPFPGLPTGAQDLSTVLHLAQDDEKEEYLSVKEVMASCLDELCAYDTDSDTADDLAYRAFFTLRFCGQSAQTIAEHVGTTSDSALADKSVSPEQFVEKFGELDEMSSLVETTAAEIQVGVAVPQFKKPFMAHSVTAHAIGGQSINGHTLEQILQTAGAAWLDIRVLDEHNNAGYVSGVAALSNEESTLNFKVTHPGSTVPVLTSAADVYKNHVAYKAEASKTDFAVVSPAQALQLALQSATHLRTSEQHHRSDDVLSKNALDKIGSMLKTPIPGAPPLAMGAYSTAQLDAQIANQMTLPASSRTTSMTLHYQNWLNTADSKLTDSGTVNEKFSLISPAASTALNMILEMHMDRIKETRQEFYFNERDILRMMRCRHGDIDIGTFQVKEADGPKKPPPFANSQTGLTLFLLALRRAKSIEIGVTQRHIDGWDHLLDVGSKLQERGFVQAEPRDFFDYVTEVFKTFTSEHRRAILSSRDISDYPAFHELADVNSFVSMAKSMITDGNRLRKQVDKIVVDKMATGGGGGGGGSKTPSKGKNKRNKIVISPTSSEESSDSPPPTSKTTSKRKKNKKKKPKTPAAAAASTRPGNARGNRTVDEWKAERLYQNSLPDGHTDLDSYQLGLRAWKARGESIDEDDAERCYRQATKGDCPRTDCPRSHKDAK